MELEDEYRILIGGYYGIQAMDEYDLKVYILKDVARYIEEFTEQNPLPTFAFSEEVEQIKDKLPLKNKLQDSLLVLNKMNGPIELTLAIKRRLKELDNIDKKEGRF